MALPLATSIAVSEPTITFTQDVASTSLPSAYPLIITPPNGKIPTQPVGSTLVQVGFLHDLNYQFVVSHGLSIAQIFDYLPQGIAYGLNASVDQIIMQSLAPYETDEYTSTVARVFVPSTDVDLLGLELHAPSSILYNNPDSSISSLFSLVDPAIPLKGALASASITSQATTSADGGTSLPNFSSTGSLSREAKLIAAIVVAVSVCTIAAVWLGGFALWRRKQSKRFQEKADKAALKADNRREGKGLLKAGANCHELSKVEGQLGVYKDMERRDELKTTEPARPAVATEFL